MNPSDPDTNGRGKTSRGLKAWIIATIVLLAIVAAGLARFPPAVIVLWGVGSVVIPIWETIDPTAPRLPPLPDVIPSLEETDARGRALRAVIDKFYDSLPETRKSWLRRLLAPPYVQPSVDISKIVRHYIPAGTSFEDAERILGAAGLTVVSLPPLEPKTTASPMPGRRIQAELNQGTTQPPGYMRLRVYLSAQGDSTSTVDRATARLSKQIGAPIPPVSVPIDASQATTIDMTVRIVEEKYYLLDLVFRGATLADMPVLNTLAGDTYLGSAFVNQQYGSGVDVPLHVTVTNSHQRILYDRTVDTRGHYAYQTLRILRRGAVVWLVPGTYSIRASTTRDIPALSNTMVEFLITYDARF